MPATPEELIGRPMMMSRTWRIAVFLALVGGGGVLMWGPLSALVRNGRPSDYYSHIPLIPVVSGYVLFRRRHKLFSEARGAPVIGTGMAVIGLGLLAANIVGRPGPIGRAELVVAGSVLLLAGGFVALFGTKALRRARFPFLFLAFMIPLPLAWMETVVSALVTGSMGVTHVLFKAFSVPFFQEGSIFRLPVFDLEVAQQCSGIRSSLALLITSVLAAQIFLNGRVRKIVFILTVFPVSIFKNGVRIITLYLLSYFVDMRIIEGGFLHKSGGFLFFGLGLVVLGYILWVLRMPGGLKGFSTAKRFFDPVE